MSAKQKKHNWPKISKEYIGGYKNETGDTIYPTLEELSEKYDIYLSIVKKHSTAEHWRDQRKTFQEEVEAKVHEAWLKKRVKDVATFNEDCYSISNTGLWHLKKTLETHILTKGQTAMPLPSLESLTRSLERLQKVESLALGVPANSLAISGPHGGPIQVNTITDLIREADELQRASKAKLPAAKPG